MYEGKRDGCVSHAVPVLIGKNEQAVVHFFCRLPLGVRSPSCSPHSPPGIDAQLHRVHEFRKHFFRGKKVDFQSVLKAHFPNRLLGAQKFYGANYALALLNLLFAEIRDDVDGLRHVGIIGFERFAVGSRPDDGVPVGRHVIELYELPLEDFVVGLIVRKRQHRPTPPYVVAVCGAVSIEPVPVLVEDGAANTLHGRHVHARRVTEQLLCDDFGNQLVSFRTQMNAVDGQRLVGFFIEPPGLRKKVHERQVFFFRNRPDGL